MSSSCREGKKIFRKYFLCKFSLHKKIIDGNNNHTYITSVLKKTNVVIMLSAASLDQQKKTSIFFDLFAEKHTHILCSMWKMLCINLHVVLMLLNWVFKWKMSFENWCFFLLTLFSIFPKNFLMTRSWCFFLAEKHWQLIYYHQKMIIFFNFG